MGGIVLRQINENLSGPAARSVYTHVTKRYSHLRRLWRSPEHLDISFELCGITVSTPAEYPIMLCHPPMVVTIGSLRDPQLFIISKTLLVVLTVSLSIVACLMYLRRLLAVLCTIHIIILMILIISS